jgi:hypothetical protein
VTRYYEQFRKVVVPILNDDPGCDEHFIDSLIENPQDQLLLINWKSVDVISLFLVSSSASWGKRDRLGLSGEIADLIRTSRGV